MKDIGRIVIIKQYEELKKDVIKQYEKTGSSETRKLIDNIQEKLLEQYERYEKE